MSEHPDIPRRNALVLQFLPLVRIVARSLKGNLPLRVDLDDLISEGTIGLIAAASQWQQNLAPFRTFAKYRIRGAMLDWLRVMDPCTRTQRSSIKNGAFLYTEESMDQRFSANTPQSQTPSPYDLAAESERKRIFADLLSGVEPTRVRRIAGEYFSGKHTQDELSKSNAINPSRISQLILIATNQIRARGDSAGGGAAVQIGNAR